MITRETDAGLVMVWRVKLADGGQYDIPFTAGPGTVVAGYEIILLENDGEHPIVAASFASHGTGYHTICSLWDDEIRKVDHG